MEIKWLRITARRYIILCTILIFDNVLSTKYLQKQSLMNFSFYSSFRFIFQGFSWLNLGRNLLVFRHALFPFNWSSSSSLSTRSSSSSWKNKFTWRYHCTIYLVINSKHRRKKLKVSAKLGAWVHTKLQSLLSENSDKIAKDTK